MPTLGQLAIPGIQAGGNLADLFIRNRGLNRATGTITSGATTAGTGIKTATQAAIDAQNATLRRQEELYNAGLAAQAPYGATGRLSLAQLQELITNPAKFEPSSVTNEPGYQFSLNEGLKAGDRAMRATGAASTGGAPRAQTRYALDYATTKYNDAFERFRQTQQDRAELLKSGVTIGQAANAADAATRTQFGGDLAANATATGNFGLRGAEDQAALDLAKAQAEAENQVQGSTATGTTLGHITKAAGDILELFKGAGSAVSKAKNLSNALPAISGVTRAVSSTAAPTIGKLASIGAAAPGSWLAGTGALAAPSIAAPSAAGISAGSAATAGSGFLGLGSMAIPVVGGIIAGGLLLAKHFVGEGRKAADKLTGQGGIQHAFEDTLQQIDSQQGYTAEQRWQSKLQAYQKLEELGKAFAQKGKNERKTAMQMFDTIGPLFGRPNPLRGTTATGTQNAALRLQEGLV